MDVLKLIPEAAEVAGSIVAGCTAENLKGSAPCEGWDGRTALNHLVGGMTLFATAARGEKPQGAGPGNEPDVIGDDPKGAFAAAKTDLLSAMGDPSVLGKTFDLGFAQLPGGVAANIVVMELLVHAWDVAKATGQEITVSDDLGKAVDEITQQVVTDEFRQPGFFGAKQDAPKGASLLEKAVAHTGRKV